MQYLLAGVATVLAVRAFWASTPDANGVRLGMSRQEVRKILGSPSGESFSLVGVCLGGTALYLRVDWLSGRRALRVNFDAHDRVESTETHYQPFAGTPPWLDALRDAFGLRPAP